MRRTIAVVGIAVFAPVIGVVGCSTAGADAAASRPIHHPREEPCVYADADSLLYLTAGGDIAEQIAQPFVFQRVDCAGIAATAYTMPDGVTPQVAVYFEYSVGSWRPIDVLPVPDL